jgi:hypothetical protein
MKIARKLEINVGKELKARDIGNLGMRAFRSLTSDNRGLKQSSILESRKSKLDTGKPLV